MEMFKKAVAVVRPGVKAKTMWDAAARVAEEAGYGRWIRPVVSHGLGLDISEKPAVGLDETILEPHMVISCEPALCTKDIGVSIEDTLLVTETGCEFLTKHEQDLGL